MNERSNDSLLPMIATAGSLSAAAIGAALAYKSMTRNLAKKASSAVSDAIESKTSSSVSASNPKSATVKNINTSGTSSVTPSNHRKTIEELNASAGSSNSNPLTSSFEAGSSVSSLPLETSNINSSSSLPKANVETTELLPDNFSSTKPSSHNYDVSRFIPINGALPDDVLKFISEAEDYQVDAINNFIESFNRVSSPDFLQKVNADRTNKLSSNLTLSFFGLDKKMSREEALINPSNYAVTAQSETLSDIVKQSKDIFDIHYDVHAPGIILHDNTTNQSVLAHKALLDGYITDIGSNEPSQTHLQMTMEALRKFSKND